MSNADAVEVVAEVHIGMRSAIQYGDDNLNTTKKMIRKILLIAILTLCFSTICSSQCIDEIKTFYTSYLMNVENGNLNYEAALCEKYLTEGLVAKTQRMVNSSGIDPIIRAQDVNEDGIKTLAVRTIVDDWYMVSYLWNERDSTTLTEIPLKAQSIDGECKIVYITPFENGVQYGDEMLSCCEVMSASKIDETSGKSFIESFYKVYLASYCAMTKDTDAKLSSLRLSNLSPTALQQFKKAESENQEDGLYGYDFLINDFYFDPMWCESLKFVQLSNDNYQITYQRGVWTSKINIKIEYQNGKYLINSISF